jgi:4-hydroxy-2-oxoheptanedioate aldolase
VIVATVDDAAMAERAVAATRYQPEGTRSYGGARFGLTNEPPDVGAVRPQVWPMIETAGGAASVEAIAAVPGVTGLLVGPADLSRAFGLPPTHRAQDPRWNETVGRVVEAARRRGIASCFTARDGEDARRWIDLGFDHVVVGSDIAHLRVALARENAIARGEAVGSMDVEV